MYRCILKSDWPILGKILVNYLLPYVLIAAGFFAPPRLRVPINLTLLLYLVLRFGGVGGLGGDKDVYESLYSTYNFGAEIADWDFKEFIWPLVFYAGAFIGFDWQPIYLLVIFSSVFLIFGSETRNENLPICVAIYFPILFTLYTLGYVRQGLAISLLTASLLSRNNAFLKIFYAVLAVGAHKVAVFGLLPLAVLAAGKYKRAVIPGMISTLIPLAYWYEDLNKKIESLINGYIVTPYPADGAIPRLSLMALFGLFLLARWRVEERMSIDRSCEKKNMYASPGGQQKFNVLGALVLLNLIALIVCVEVPGVSSMTERIVTVITGPLLLAYSLSMPCDRSDRGSGLLPYVIPLSSCLIILISLAYTILWLRYSDHAQYWLLPEFLS